MSYFVNNTDHLCYSCNLEGCLTCETLYTCSVCDVPNNYNLVNSSQICKLCPYTCICDGYYLPKYFDPVLNATICTTVCGDGKTREKEECDDGNTINYDGCSSTCRIEHLWNCASTNLT
jgi:cysteine-rich repeat protein